MIPAMNRADLWVNLLGFQLLWWVAILGAARGLVWPALLLAPLLLAWHLRQASSPGREAVLLLLLTLLGAVADALLIASGWLRFSQADLGPALTPSWMLALWLGFATSLNVSLRWLRARPLMAALLGAAGGVASYAGGARLGAAVLPEPASALLAVALCWAVLMPLAGALALRLDGFAPRDPAVNS